MEVCSYKRPFKCYKIMWPHSSWHRCDASLVCIAFLKTFFLLLEWHHFQIPVSHQAAWHIWYIGTKSLRKYKIGVLNLSELMIRESVAGNGYHKACGIETRLITDPWWHSCVCEDFIFPPVDLGECVETDEESKKQYTSLLTKQKNFVDVWFLCLMGFSPFVMDLTFKN